MSTQLPSSFALELVDSIFCHLRKASPSTLAACAIVCHEWHPIAQKQLFQSIRLDDRNSVELERITTSLAKTLQAKKNLQSFVRELHVEWSAKFLDTFLDSVTLPHLHTLKLKNINFSKIYHVFEAIADELDNFHPVNFELADVSFQSMSAFASFIFLGNTEKETLNRLHLHRVSLFQREGGNEALIAEADEDHLARCLAIPEERRGDYHNAKIQRLQEEKQERDRKLEQRKIELQELALIPRPKVRELEIVRGMANSLASWLSGPESTFDLTELRSLRYEADLDPPLLSGLRQTLAKCGSNLQHLEIYSPRALIPQGHFIDISPRQLTDLQSLTISGINIYSITNAISWLSQLNSSDNKIKHLAVKFSPHTAPPRGNPPPTHTWADFDQAVDDLPLLSLEQIEVIFPNWRKQSEKEVTQRCKELLPRVMARDICRLTVL